MQLKLQTYFRQMRTIVRTNFVQEEVMGKLSTQLVEVLHGRWFDNIWWLKNVSRTNFVVLLTLDFSPMLYCPHEAITSTDRLHVINRGLCIVGRQLLTRDDSWGVDMLLMQEHLRIRLHAVAVSYLNVLFLTREKLWLTLEKYPRERELVCRAYRVLCIMRGMVWKANRIKMEEKLRKEELENQRALAPTEVAQPQAKVPKRGHLESKTFSRLFRGNSARIEGSAAPAPVPAPVAQDEETIISDAIRETEEQLATLEQTMASRLESVEKRMAEALTIISDVSDVLQRPA